MEIKIIPAIIAKTQEELDEKVNKVKKHADILQFDVMDNKFVPNDSINFDFKVPDNNCKIEAHLMVDKPGDWIEKHALKADTILAHFESCRANAGEVIESIKKLGKQAGLVINPDTSVEEIKPFLSQLDEVLVMTVTPGFYGSAFLPETLDKVSEIRKLAPDLNIEVDGGITPDTIKQAHNAGANMFVSGSFIVKSDDVEGSIKELQKKIEGE